MQLPNLKKCAGLSLLLLGMLPLLVSSQRNPEPPRTVRVPPPSGSLPPAPLPFQRGETFHYNISWKIFDAGIATMTLTDRFRNQEEEVYRISATVRSTGIVSTFFPVSDTFESYLQIQELCSRRIVKYVREGWRYRDTLLTFDPKNRKAVLEEKIPNAPQAPVKHLETPIPECVQDVISALYAARIRQFQVGEKFRFPINDGGTTYDVEVEVQAEEQLKTPAGTFETYRLEPQVFGGLFKKKGRMFVWFSKDQAKIPVQIKARILVGTITATLARIEKGPQIQPGRQ
jgi:hypothetical protein